MPPITCRGWGECLLNLIEVSMNHCAIFRCFKHLRRLAQWNQGCTCKRKSGLWRIGIAVVETRHVRWEGPGYRRPSFVRLGNGVASMGSEPHERHKKSTPSPVHVQFLRSSLSTRISVVRSPLAAPREIRVRNTDLGFRVWPASRMLFRAQDLDSLWLTTTILYSNSLVVCPTKNLATRDKYATVGYAGSGSTPTPQRQ